MKLRIALAIFIITSFPGLLLSAGCDSAEKRKKISLEDRVTEAELNALTRQNGAGVLWFGFDRRSSPQEDARQYLPLLKFPPRSCSAD